MTTPERLDPSELRARILAAAKADPSPTRAESIRATTTWAAAGFALEIALFIGIGMVHRGPRPDWLIFGTTAAAVFVALAATVLSFGRGRSMLGRPTQTLWAVTVLAPIFLLAVWALFGGNATPLQQGAGLEETAPRCFALTTLLALGPSVALVWVRRGSDPVHPVAQASAIAVAAAAWGAVGMGLLCPDARLSHILLGHLLPALPFALIGGWIGGRLLAPKLREEPARSLPT